MDTTVTVTPEQAAIITGRSRRTVYHWLHTGQLVAYKKHGRWCIDPTSLTVRKAGKQ